MGTRGEAEPLRVLVVEDDLDVAEKVVALLKEEGHVVTLAADGGAAVRHATSDKPDVVLMDLGLPTVDGWTALRIIRGRFVQGDRPYLIAVSAFGDAMSRQRAFEAGCDEYIVKPYDVRGALRAFIARRPGQFPEA